MSEETNKSDDIIDIEPQVISEASPAEKKAMPRRNWRNAGLAAVLGLLFAVAGGWIYRQTLSNYFPTDQVAAISQRMDGVETLNKDMAKRVDAVIALTDELKSKLGAAQAAAEKSLKIATTVQGQSDGTFGELSTLKQNLASALTTIDEVKLKLTNGASTGGAIDPTIVARIAALEKTLTTQDAVTTATKTDTAKMAQALAKMKSKIADGLEFQADFDVLKNTAPEADGLDILATVAATGSANSAQLAKEIDGIIAQLPKVDAQPAAPQSWFDEIGSYFSGLISIKPLGESDISVAAQKASAFAASGDLPQALDVLNKSGLPLPPDLQRWHEKTTTRINVEQALAKASAAIALLIAAKG
jgi:hypothetical protein